MSMKVPEIVRQAKQALHEGYAVVIGLQTTGEVGPIFYNRVVLQYIKTGLHSYAALKATKALNWFQLLRLVACISKGRP